MAYSSGKEQKLAAKDKQKGKLSRTKNSVKRVCVIIELSFAVAAVAADAVKSTGKSSNIRFLSTALTNVIGLIGRQW